MGPRMESPGPVFGDYGPFWACLGPHLGPTPGTATRAHGALWRPRHGRAFQVPKAIVCRPNIILDSVVTFFSILGPLLPCGLPGALPGYLLLLACCLLGAQAPRMWPNNLINGLKYYALQLGDLNQ